MSAPVHLSADASAVWDEVTTGLSTSGPEGPALEAYCVQVARMRDAQRRIDDEGLVVADEKGRPIPHPAIVLERQAQVEVRQWASRYEPHPGRSRRQR